MTMPGAITALILAGGLGTRLQGLVADRPKPMAEASGKPFLEYLIQQLLCQEFEEIVLCVGHQAGQIYRYFGDGRRWGGRIRYAVETQLLGTAGAIRNARNFVTDTFLVLNGDSYLEADFHAVIQSHQRRRGADPHAVGTIATVAVEDATPYGTVDLDSRGHVLRFREKASGGAGQINGGIYVLEPEVLQLIPSGQAVSIERGTFPLALDSGWHLYGYPVEGFFVDIGTPQGYRRFQRYVEEKGL